MVEGVVVKEGRCSSLYLPASCLELTLRDVSWWGVHSGAFWLSMACMHASRVNRTCCCIESLLQSQANHCQLLGASHWVPGH
jgi:hypothetical protein